MRTTAMQHNCLIRQTAETVSTAHLYARQSICPVGRSVWRGVSFLVPLLLRSLMIEALRQYRFRGVVELQVAPSHDSAESFNSGSWLHGVWLS